MSNFRLLCVGEIKSSALKTLINEYLEKINHYQKLEVIQVKDESIIADRQKVLNNEAQALLKHIKYEDFVVLIDLHGSELDSLKFAQKIDHFNTYYPKVVFVIAGSLGYGKEIIERANYRLCLSKLTFLHQMTRLIFLEQLYRAFKILNNETYHK